MLTHDCPADHRFQYHTAGLSPLCGASFPHHQRAANLKVAVLFGGPLAQPKQALMRADEDGIDVPPLQVRVQGRRHCRVRRLPVAGDEAALHGQPGNVPCMAMWVQTSRCLPSFAWTLGCSELPVDANLAGKSRRTAFCRNAAGHFSGQLSIALAQSVVGG